IFQFLWVWNDLLVALVFGFNNPPITYAIREQTRAFSSNIDVIAPGALVSMAVPLVLFFAFQRYFLRGMLAGALKGAGIVLPGAGRVAGEGRTRERSRGRAVPRVRDRTAGRVVPVGAPAHRAPPGRGGPAAGGTDEARAAMADGGAFGCAGRLRPHDD